VRTRDEKGHIGPVERLVVIRSLEGPPKTWYTLSNAAAEVPLAEVVHAHGEQHRVEEFLQQGKGEVGLGQYEARGWDDWHHHMTLALLALWFLVLERLRLGEKKPALTVAQAREVFTRLLRDPPPRPGQIAEEINRVLRRKEEARIYHWHRRTGEFPPRRSTPAAPRGPPQEQGLQ
jgi:hypothetical protein